MVCWSCLANTFHSEVSYDHLFSAPIFYGYIAAWKEEKKLQQIIQPPQKYYFFYSNPNISSLFFHFPEKRSIFATLIQVVFEALQNKEKIRNSLVS